jgi:hypothetical protein
MEDVMYPPSYGESQLIHYRRDLFDDFKGSISFGVELHFLMVDFEVGCF